MREEAFFGLELTRVYASPSSLDANGMFEVKHLVVEQVFYGRTRGIWSIEDAADDDGVVGGVVVTEHTAGVMSAPGKDGTPEQTMEEAYIERLEDLIKVEVMPLWGENAFPAPGLTDM